MPPPPMIGIFTVSYIFLTAASPIGFIDGPDNPPVLFDKTGLPEYGSITVAGATVFIAEMASAPASSAAFAMIPIS